MSFARADDPATKKPPVVRTRGQLTLPRRTYRFRVLGMGLASLPLMVVMTDLQSSGLAWSWVLITCLFWPHLAYLRAIRSKDPFRTELQNFVLDSAFAGSWVPLIHFNLLPSAILLGVTMADKVNTGVRRLWLYSIPAIIGSLLTVGVFTGFSFAPITSMRVILACLPIMIIHTLAVSLSSYKLVRRVQMQNQRLEELSRVDALTGLSGRRHWQAQAESLRQKDCEGADIAVLVLDIDQFKDINDRYGHAVGDDVLRAIAGLIRREIPTGSHAGRLGGDELAILVSLSLHEAENLAERIRLATSQLVFSTAPELSCSVSIGVVGNPNPAQGLREWIESADRALYRAKRSGRNQSMSATLIESVGQ